MADTTSRLSRNRNARARMGEKLTEDLSKSPFSARDDDITPLPDYQEVTGTRCFMGKDDAQTIKLSGEASNANVEKEVLEKALAEKDAMIESLQRDLENQRQVSSCLTADLSREQWKSQMWYSSARNTYDIVKAECDEEITEVQQEAKRIKLNAEEEAQAVKSKAEKEIALANAHAEASKQVADKRADGVFDVMDSNFDLLSMLAAIEPLLEGLKREAVHARVIKGALEEHERLSGIDYEMREKWKKVKG